jgi:hypothetical protein
MNPKHAQFFCELRDLVKKYGADIQATSHRMVRFGIGEDYYHTFYFCENSERLRNDIFDAPQEKDGE